MNVAAGDKVSAGQVLATMDSASLESAVSSAESDLAERRGHAVRRAVLRRVERPDRRRHVADPTATDALTDAQEALAGATLVATFDGTVASVNVTVGEQLGSNGAGGTDADRLGRRLGQVVVDARQPVERGATERGSNTSSTADILVVSTGRYKAELEVDSSQISQIKVGDAVTVTVSSGSSNGFPGFGNLAGATNGANATRRERERRRDGDHGGTSDSTATGRSPRSGRSPTPFGRRAVPGHDRVHERQQLVRRRHVHHRRDRDLGPDTDVIQVPIRAVTTYDGASTVTVALDGNADGRTEKRTVETGESAAARSRSPTAWARVTRSSSRTGR